MDRNLPKEWNIRAGMAANLSKEAESAGDGREARKYLLDAIRLNECHLRTASKAPTDYYKDHFPDWTDRRAAWFRWAVSRLNGFIWGYGERGFALLRSVLLTIALFFALFWITQVSIHTAAGQEANAGDWVWLSAASIVSNSAATGLTVDGWARAFVLLEGAAGRRSQRYGCPRRWLPSRSTRRWRCQRISKNLREPVRLDRDRGHVVVWLVVPASPEDRGGPARQ
jgi:hypothetical protein